MKKQQQNIHGIVLLDKPTGMSSNKALQQVKRLFNAKKAGHTGSLDPLATGLLPICLGQATKVCEYLLHSHKRYTTVLKLGETTDTLDSDGEIVQRKEFDLSDEQIIQALEQFKGHIKQIPPMYSALKKDGQPLYKLARQGKVIDRPARDMTVFELLAKRIDKYHVELKVHCSSGFYIRSLVHDLGEALGCGAHVVSLRRTAIKSVGVEQALSYEQLADLASQSQVLLPIDSLINDMPILEITPDQQTLLDHGKVTMAEGSVAKPSEVDLANPYSGSISRLYTQEGVLFGLGHITDSGQLKTDKRFMTSL